MTIGEDENKKRIKRGWGYTLFTSYVRFLHNAIYYRNAKTIDKKNVPKNGSLMVVCNHQNNVFDPIGLLVVLYNRNKRKVQVISRADMFSKPLANKVLRWMGILPSFRLAVDGEESLQNNRATFDEVENELLNDGTVIIFPEAGDIPQRRLRVFSQGYLHILFEAAEKSNFTKELFILPSINHYSDYYAMQSDMLIKFGKPIALSPFYESYKSKPRTTKREINALVRKQMSDMMLDIHDEKNYDSIDYLRNTYGIKYARRRKYNPFNIYHKLLSDKRLYSRLEAERATNEALVQGIYNQAAEIRNEAVEKGIGERDITTKYVGLSLLGRVLLLLLLLPTFIACLAPWLLLLIFPNMAAAKVGAPMLRIPAKAIVSAAIIPITMIIIFIGIYVHFGSFLLALAALFLAPCAGILAISYYNFFQNWRKDLRVFQLRKTGKLGYMQQSTKELHAQLDQLLRGIPETKK